MDWLFLIRKVDEFHHRINKWPLAYREFLSQAKFPLLSPEHPSFLTCQFFSSKRKVWSWLLQLNQDMGVSAALSWTVGRRWDAHDPIMNKLIACLHLSEIWCIHNFKPILPNLFIPLVLSWHYFSPILTRIVLFICSFKGAYRRHIALTW